MYLRVAQTGASVRSVARIPARHKGHNQRHGSNLSHFYGQDSDPVFKIMLAHGPTATQRLIRFEYYHRFDWIPIEFRQQPENRTQVEENIGFCRHFSFPAHFLNHCPCHEQGLPPESPWALRVLPCTFLLFWTIPSGIWEQVWKTLWSPAFNYSGSARQVFGLRQAISSIP